MERLPMNTVTLLVEIPADHHLVLDLPAELPVGQAEVTIKPQSAAYQPPLNPAREAARTKLLAAGKLVTDIRAPEGIVPLSPEELLRIGTLPPAPPSSHALLDE